jgi:gliding motility-associated-like protein/uncharacterized repeat protein (TIGR01451 family)
VTICSGETYTWTVNGTAYTESGTYLVTNNGCTANQELVLTVMPPIQAPVSGGNQTICSDGTTTQTLTATATGGTITWYDAATAGNIVATPTQVGRGTKTYYAQSSNDTCSSLTRTAVILTINSCSLEVIKTADKSNYDTLGEVITYTIEIRNTGNVDLHQVIVTDPLTNLNTTIESLAVGASKVFTEVYTVTQSDLNSNSVINIASATGLTPNNINVSNSDTVVVEKSIVLPCGLVTVHNAFSPNGDGINELFIIDNIDNTNCYPENTVEIYNRWGVLVFETKGYNNTTNAFNGTSRGRTTIDQSSGLPTGTYYYILNYTFVDGNGQSQVSKKAGYLYLTK